MSLRLMDVHNDLQNHKAEDRTAHLGIQETRNDIKTIKENHLTHMQASLTKLETNLDWMMKFFWIIVPAIVGSLVIGVMNLLLK